MNRKILPKGFGEDTGPGLKCVEDQRDGSRQVCKAIETGLSRTMEFHGHRSNSKLSNLRFSNQVRSGLPEAQHCV